MLLLFARQAKDMKRCLPSLVLCLLLCSTNAVEYDQHQFDVTEGINAGTIVGNLMAAAGLDETFDDDQLSQLRFSVLEQSPSEGLFSVDDNGLLRAAKTVDRDVICARQTTCVVSLTVQVQPRQFSRILRAAVTIVDLNDNSPVFTEHTKALPLSETSPLGIVCSIRRPSDEDSPRFGIQRYELLNGMDTFELKTEGTQDLQILLTAPLDYETVKSYTIELVAYDGGSPPRSGSLRIEISVLDANDNQPRFESASYEITVDENLPLETPIIRVTATDADSGSNGEIVYGFSDETADVYGELFTIDTSTGDVIVVGNLDHEQHESCGLTVTARNRNPESLVVTTEVRVNIFDLNDNAPVVKVNVLPSSDQLEVSEGSPIGTYVVYLTVRDADSGVNGNFDCVLYSNYFTLRQLHKTGFQIETSGDLDREATSTDNVTLECTDGGATPLTSSETLVIHILDKNDNSPKFTESTYVASILENNVPGAFVIRAAAHDADLNENSRLSYSIKDEHFDIDAESGNITAVSALDYEQTRRIEFSVVAMDHGVPSLTNVAMVIVTIIDVDDEVPVFSETHYQFELYENVPLGAEVGTVSATDADSSHFNSFFFSIDPESDAGNSFGVDPYSGKLFTTKEMDRESQATYEFVVLATSSGLLAVSTETSVSVLLSDTNDNSPVIDYPRTDNNTVFVSPQFPVGRIIYRVMAHDEDTGVNAQLRFIITSGDRDNVFEIERSSGAVIIAAELSEFDDERFRLVVAVSDAGTPRLETECIVNVVINGSVAYTAARTTNDTYSPNLTIVICIAAITAVLTAVLLAAILVIVRRHSVQRWNNKYRCHIHVCDRKALTGPASSTDGATSLGNKCDAHDSNDSYGSEQQFSLHTQENAVDCCSLQVSIVFNHLLSSHLVPLLFGVNVSDSHTARCCVSWRARPSLFRQIHI